MRDLVILETLTEAEREAQRVLDLARGYPEIERRAHVVKQIACLLRGVRVTPGDLAVLDAQRSAMYHLAASLPAS